MIEILEWQLQTVVQNAVATYQANAATLTPEIFATAPAYLQTELQNTLGNPATQIAVNLAYVPNAQPALPGVWIYGTPGQEQQERDLIGNVFAQVPVLNSSGQVTGYTERSAVYATSSWNLTCAAVNVNAALGLFALVKWALYQARLSLGQPPYELISQVMSWSVFSPMANSAGDVIFPYQRTLTFTAEHLESWSQLDDTLITAYDPTFIHA